MAKQLITMEERKKEMQDFIKNFEGMPERLLKYCEISLEGENASPYIYQDTMSFRRLAIGLTTVCNSNCIWCDRKEPRNEFLINREMPLEKLKKIIKNTAGKFRMVHVAELGEPLLYPHLLEAIQLLKNLSDKIKITTNGRLLTEKIIDDLVKAGLTHIEVSLDAFTEEENLKYRGSSLKYITEKLIYISENTNLQLQINSVVANININSLMKIVEALKEVKNINVIHMIPLIETEECKRSKIERVADEVFRKLLNKIKSDIKEYNLNWKLIPSPDGVALDPVIEMKRRKNICFACFEDPTIDIDGKLLPCVWTKPYDGPDATIGLEKALNHPKLVEFRKNMLTGNYPALCGMLCYLKEKKEVQTSKAGEIDDQEYLKEDDDKSLIALYGLPPKVIFCKKCVISNQRPNSEIEFAHNIETKKKSIRIDEAGICDACRLAEKKEKEINWQDREEQLRKLCDQSRRNDGSYDCIVPGSGGKDSVKAAWLLKYKYKMHPLTVTWAPHLYTPYGWNNFVNWSHKGGFDNILFTPNGRVHRLITRLAFINILHPFQPFILGQKNIGAIFALKYNVPLVFYGENEAEYGNPIKDNVTALRSAKFHAGKDYMNMCLGGVSVKDLINKHGLSLVDLKPYLPLDPEEVERAGIQVHYVGYYERWDPQESYYFAVEKTGFQPNDQRTEGTYSKYISIDDKTDPFHYWTTLIKFGIGRTTYDASQEIRNKKITREEGIALVKKFDQEFPKRYFPEFLEYLDMTEKEFFETADGFRSPHLWKKENGEWRLRHTVWQD